MEPCREPHATRRRLERAALASLAALLGSLPLIPEEAFSNAANRWNPSHGDSAGTAQAAALRPQAQHQEFVWDFTDCYDRSVRTDGTEFVDAERLNLSGGCHLRFLTAGQSWLEMPFTLAEEPGAAAGQGGAWTISMLHLAIRPEGPAPGLAPVRATLNGEEVWSGPIPEGRYGPLNLWAANDVDVTAALRRGPNTLRYEFVGDGATHYWLKLVRLGWDPR